MDRTKYLNLCKECAMICDEGVYGMKVNVPERLQVRYKMPGYDEHKYYPVGYELSFNRDGSTRHIAIIHDLEANSICHAPLKDVK